MKDFTGADYDKFVIEPVIPEATVLPVIGDVNGDGSVASTDLVMLQKYLLGAGTLTMPVSADVNQDGAIDVFDNVALRKLLISK